MIDKTDALVLRIAPFSRTSHVVTWLTSEYGKLATVIKGARRPRSMFLGQYDLFYTCELLFYARDRNGLHIARECTPLNARRALRRNWRACLCASYICDLMSRISMEGGHQRELFEVASSAMDYLCANGASLQFLFWFELRLVKIMGLAPQLMKCPVCGRALRDVCGTSLFSSSRGGILCPNCARSAGSGFDSAISVSPDILAILRSWQNAGSSRAAQNTKCTSNQLLVFQKLLGGFMNYHLDIMPVSRKIAIEIITSHRYR